MGKSSIDYYFIGKARLFYIREKSIIVRRKIPFSIRFRVAFKTFRILGITSPRVYASNSRIRVL